MSPSCAHRDGGRLHHRVRGRGSFHDHPQAGTGAWLHGHDNLRTIPTAARLINQSMPISHFMKTEDLITFEDSDCIDDMKEVMASKRHRDFPVLDKDGKYLGMISRRNLLGARRKQIILVDHNEKNQAVDGHGECQISRRSLTTIDWVRRDNRTGILPQPAAGMYGNHRLSDVPGEQCRDR